MSPLNWLSHTTKNLKHKLSEHSPRLQRPDTKAQVIRLIISNPSQVYESALDKPICLGRDTQSVAVDLAFPDGIENGISRGHAKILKKDGRVFIFDMGSLNGTWVNDQKLTSYAPVEIKDGDLVLLGKLLIQVMLPGG